MRSEYKCFDLGNATKRGKFYLREFIKYTLRAIKESDKFSDVRKILPKWETSIFNYVSENLLARGYRDKYDEGINVIPLTNLLNQALEIVKKQLKEYDCSYAENLEYMHDFFSGDVYHTVDSKERIVIVKNDENGYALMLPSDLTTFETKVKLPFKNLFFDGKVMKRLSRFKK